MGLTLTIGNIFCGWVFYLLNMPYGHSNNIEFMLTALNILLLHSHDIRMGKFILPLPDAINFVVYHRVHHID